MNKAAKSDPNEWRSPTVVLIGLGTKLEIEVARDERGGVQERPGVLSARGTGQLARGLVRGG